MAVARYDLAATAVRIRLALTGVALAVTGSLAAAPHSEATLSIVGDTGVVILVMTVCLAVMDSFPRLRR
ncbi:hypothetical protein [Streptomyces coeruleorubidus]|uniref:hypothetical protein n=1 Tax=Streptomyces coeruleorubidus TaxID=116188 RepID=UPI0037BAF9DE